jgi:hypothetical protein
MIPSKTKYGKFRKREWIKNAKLPMEKFSVGQWNLLYEAVDIDNGTILTGFKGAMNCCLYSEAINLEEDMRKKHIILLTIKAIKIN